MPKTQEILTGLNAIANEYSLFAILWHVIFYILIISLVARWVPSNRLFGTLICIPLFSVAVFAWLTGNPFNGTLFSIITILTLVFGLKAAQQPVSCSQLPFMIIGVIMIVFGLVYPHFIETGSFYKYLYASPVGLIPCPTLSILIGLILLFNGFGSQATTLTFIVFGLFYGFFGVLKLGVYLDLFLILGTLTLLTKYILTILK
jgi:hypothetical protein